MSIFVLEQGLVVQRGAQTLEYLRQIDENAYQFEDKRTLMVHNFKLSRLVADIGAKRLTVVLGNAPQYANPANEENRPVILTDLTSLKEKERAQLERVMDYVMWMRRKKITKGQRYRIEIEIPKVAKSREKARRKEGAPPQEEKLPKPSAVMAWMREYEKSGCNPAALLSGNRCRRRQKRLPHEVEEVVDRKIRTVYLQPYRHTLRHTRELVLEELKRLVAQKKLCEADARVSLATIQRRVQDFDPYDRDRARFGSPYARAKYRTTVEGNRASRVLQRLECDHTLLDFVVVCDRTWLPLGRPTLTLLVDSNSGYIVGVYISFYGPGLTSAINVIKNGILPKDEWVTAAGLSQPWLGCGIPEMFVFDNGLEFHSRQLRLVAWELGVDVKYCRTRMPWVKPRVERFFAELGYLTLTRGRVHKPQPNTVWADPAKENCITFSAFVIGLLKFIVEVHPFELNSRRLELPFDLFKEGCDLLPPPAFPLDLERLNMIAAMSKQLTVAHHGVEFEGLNYSGEEVRDLRRRVGAKFTSLVKWNPDDLSLAYIKDPTSDAWVAAPSMQPEYTTGLSWVQHKAIRAFKRAKGIAGSDALMRARLALHDHWGNEMKKAKSRLSQQRAAKFLGISSNQVVLPEKSRSQIDVLVPQEEMTVPPKKEIATLEAFVM